MTDPCVTFPRSKVGEGGDPHSLGRRSLLTNRNSNLEVPPRPQSPCAGSGVMPAGPETQWVEAWATLVTTRGPNQLLLSVPHWSALGVTPERADPRPARRAAGVGVGGLGLWGARR